MNFKLKNLEKDNSEMYDNRIETKLSLRKVKVKEALSKMKMSSCNIPYRSNKINETCFLIDTKKLGLKSDILNRMYTQDDFLDYYSFNLDLLKSNNLNKAKYAVSNFRNVIIGLNDNYPVELVSIEFLSSLYLLLSNNRFELDLVVSLLY
jgi:hypothetical protein